MTVTTFYLQLNNNTSPVLFSPGNALYITGARKHCGVEELTPMIRDLEQLTLDVILTNVMEMYERKEMTGARDWALFRRQNT